LKQFNTIRRFDTLHISVDGYHGKGGEMMLSVPDYTGLGEVFVEAANELGYPRADLNGNFTEGLQKMTIN
jgi:hypothetical protein